MKGRRYKVKYNDQDKFIDINGHIISGNLIALSYPNVEADTSGFIIYQGDETIMDCSDFKYRWDVLEDNPNKIYYTNTEGYVQEKAFNHENMIEDVDPLNNEELTECVADLMYEMSLTQLGMTGGE